MIYRHDTTPCTDQSLPTSNDNNTKEEEISAANALLMLSTGVDHEIILINKDNSTANDASNKKVISSSCTYVKTCAKKLSSHVTIDHPYSCNIKNHRKRIYTLRDHYKNFTHNKNKLILMDNITKSIDSTITNKEKFHLYYNEVHKNTVEKFSKQIDYNSFSARSCFLKLLAENSLNFSRSIFKKARENFPENMNYFSARKNAYHLYSNIFFLLRNKISNFISLHDIDKSFMNSKLIEGINIQELSTIIIPSTVNSMLEKEVNDELQLDCNEFIELFENIIVNLQWIVSFIKKMSSDFFNVVKYCQNLFITTIRSEYFLKYMLFKKIKGFNRRISLNIYMKMMKHKESLFSYMRKIEHDQYDKILLLAGYSNISKTESQAPEIFSNLHRLLRETCASLRPMIKTNGIKLENDGKLVRLTDIDCENLIYAFAMNTKEQYLCMILNKKYFIKDMISNTEESNIKQFGADIIFQIKTLDTKIPPALIPCYYILSNLENQCKEIADITTEMLLEGTCDQISCVSIDKFKYKLYNNIMSFLLDKLSNIDIIHDICKYILKVNLLNEMKIDDMVNDIFKSEKYTEKNIQENILCNIKIDDEEFKKLIPSNKILSGTLKDYTHGYVPVAMITHSSYIDTKNITKLLLIKLHECQIVPSNFLSLCAKSILFSNPQKGESRITRVEKEKLSSIEKLLDSKICDLKNAIIAKIEISKNIDENYDGICKNKVAEDLAKELAMALDNCLPEVYLTIRSSSLILEDDGCISVMGNKRRDDHINSFICRIKKKNEMHVSMLLRDV